MSSFAKFLIQGDDAEAELNRLCANDVAVPPGTSVYTGLLNARGTYESDVTVSRLSQNEFLMLSGTAQAVRDPDWISRNMKPGASVSLTDVTSAYAVISVMGPRVAGASQPGVGVLISAMNGFRLRPCARSTLVTHACWRVGAPTSANSAGNSTSRRSLQPVSTMCCSMPAQSSAFVMAATMPSRACAWRRDIAHGGAN